MDINKELDEIFNDPLLNISDKEKELFAIPTDMKKANKMRKQPDYYAQKKGMAQAAAARSAPRCWM